MLHEVLGRDDGHVRIGTDDAEHAAEVVDVGMRVDHRRDGSLAALGSVEGEAGGGALGRDEGVDHDHALVALDDGHVREVETSELVDAVSHRVEPLSGGELALTPEARVHGVGTVAGEEAEGVDVPHHLALGVAHDARLQADDEAEVGVGEVGGVREVSRHDGLRF